MPKLWNDTIASHRSAVRDATLDAAATLVAERGLPAVTMSAIAQRTGIGRATLYKYFPDIEAVLAAWHERQVRAHLAQLAALQDTGGNAMERLRGILERYAALSGQRHGASDGGRVRALHTGGAIEAAHAELLGLVANAIRAAAEEGGIRDDASAEDLAAYALHALGAASAMPPGRSLVEIVIDGMRKR